MVLVLKVGNIGVEVITFSHVHLGADEITSDRTLPVPMRFLGASLMVGDESVLNKYQTLTYKVLKSDGTTLVYGNSITQIRVVTYQSAAGGYTQTLHLTVIGEIA
jgi:hypothetical protein